MAVPAAAVTTGAPAANPPTPSLLSLPHELITSIAGHLWASGHGAAWSAFSRTCAAAHGACLDAVRRVELPPVTPESRSELEQPLGGSWRAALEGDVRRYSFVGAGASIVDVANLVPFSAQTHFRDQPNVCTVNTDYLRPEMGPTTHDPAVTKELVRSVAAFLVHLKGTAECSGSGGRGLRAARFGRIHQEGRQDMLPYSPANADVLGRLLPPLAACPLEAFAADGWPIRLLGRSDARLSVGPLTTLRLRRAGVGDGPTHSAIASVLRAHAAELEEVVVGLEAEYLTGGYPNDWFKRTHHFTGYLAHWLGAAESSPLWPPPTCSPSDTGCRAPPVQLSRLRVLSFLGSVDAVDVAALVVAAPRLSSLCLYGAVGRGALKGLALPALPELDHLELHAAIEATHLYPELPAALSGRPPLSVLRLPAADDVHDSTAAGEWVWGSGELWAGEGSSVCVPCELIASTIDNKPWMYDDVSVKLVCGQGTAGSETPHAADGVGPGTTAGTATAAARVGGWVPAVGLRSLTIALGRAATDGAVASLAALPALTTLRLRLDQNVGVRLSSWPAFPALTRLALVLSNDDASCGVTAAAALAALSAPPSAAPTSLAALQFKVLGHANGALIPAHVPTDEVDGWVSPPPDLSPLASWTSLRELTWESFPPVGGNRYGCETNSSTSEEVRMAATVRRVAASLPRVATTVCAVQRGDLWGPEGRYRSDAYFSHPVGGEPDGSVGVQGI